jgi:hypothetical protein
MNLLFWALPTALLLAAPSFAQTKTDKAHVQWGADLNIKDDGEFLEVIDDYDNSTFLLVKRKKDVFVQRMDGLKAIWQKPLDLELDKNDLTLQRILVTKEDLIVFASSYDKKLNENSLFACSFDQAGFTPGKRWEKLDVIPAERSSQTGRFLISASPNRSKILVESLPPENKGVSEKYRIGVYDASLNNLWSQQFDEVPYTVESQRLDNDGSVVVLGVKYAEKEEKRELKRAHQATYEYHLLVYQGNSPEPQDYPITVTDKFLQDMTLSMGDEGDIICAGLYGNKDAQSVRGAFFLRLDRTSKQVTHSSYKAFSDDFITMYLSEKKAEKAKKNAEKKDKELELPEYSLHGIIRRDDGGAVLLAEQYYINYYTYTYSTGNGGTTTRTVVQYSYNDVLVINIDPEGNIEWASKVPKRQISQNDGGMYSSFAVDVKNDHIYLVFNDSGENLFLKPGDKVHQFSLTGKDALVVLATIDKDGNTTREPLFSPERRDVILRPKDCVQLEDKSMFIYASRKKDYRYGLIEFK